MSPFRQIWFLQLPIALQIYIHFLHNVSVLKFWEIQSWNFDTADLSTWNNYVNTAGSWESWRISCMWWQSPWTGNLWRSQLLTHGPAHQRISCLPRSSSWLVYHVTNSRGNGLRSSLWNLFLSSPYYIWLTNSKTLKAAQTPHSQLRSSWMTLRYSGSYPLV